MQKPRRNCLFGFQKRGLSRPGEAPTSKFERQIGQVEQNRARQGDPKRFRDAQERARDVSRGLRGDPEALQDRLQMSQGRSRGAPERQGTLVKPIRVAKCSSRPAWIDFRSIFPRCMRAAKCISTRWQWCFVDVGRFSLRILVSCKNLAKTPVSDSKNKA